MATLALAVAGAAAGGALLPGGVSILGATLSGATIGSQIGALAGSFIDQSLLASSGRAPAQYGPRLSEVRVTTSSEGAAIPRLYGRARLGGQIIWASNFEEEVVQQTVRASGSGKGIGGSGGASSTSIEYRYFANFAVALAEGPITGIGRVWADGQELDLSTITFRLYLGDDGQLPDSLIEAKEGTGDAPAYRGVAYIVFEHMALAGFGNRIPQLSFEVFRAVDDFETKVRAVCLIPGAGEFVYAPEPVVRRVGVATTVSENTHTRQGGTDFSVAVDQLQAHLPNAGSVSLIVGWFGTDLRADHCEIRPGVDAAAKTTEPLAWSVAGQVRDIAHLVSEVAGRPAYGGTPSDAAVIAGIQDLQARGLAVTLASFIFMDVPASNALPDPYSDASTQPLYPWRGRITVYPAAGRPGSPDQTAAAATQLADFIGTAQVSDFAIVDDDVVYSGPAEWSYRRFILHYAHLCAAAGGVEGFLIGSEMRGLTWVRDSASHYPFVDALVDLAADVKSVLGSGTSVVYAADWSEYFGHQPPDGSGDVYFHLDPVWASPDIDAIGIDMYWPLADWRAGNTHLDRLAGASSPYDLDYLRANLFAGEGYDWYYASPADRDAQVRTPITDGAGKPWVFRFKDIRNWWSNAHYNRPGGVELGAPTAWVAQSKPIWFTEIGCPAVDKGANQPNVFVDPKSSESFLPYYSQGRRDDYMQRCYLQAVHEAFDPADANYLAGANPLSSGYDGRMLDLAHVHVYCWDARPYPAYPADTDVWGDGANWRLGHWITGRVGGAPLAATIGAILDDHGFDEYDASRLAGSLSGFLVDRVLSARETLQPLELAFFVDSRESDGRIAFTHRGLQLDAPGLTPDDLVERRPGETLATLTRAQETDLPASAKLTFISAAGAYPPAVEEARRLAGKSGRVAVADVPIVLDPEQAAQMADVWLFEAWAARERASFTLPPSRLALEPGDIVSLEAGGRTRLLRITEIGEHGERDADALGIDPEIYGGGSPVVREVPTPPALPVLAPPFVAFLDLPLLRGDESPQAGYVAAAQIPWPGAVAIYRSPETANFLLKAFATAPAVTGVTLDVLPAAAHSRWDRASRIRVRLDQGTLTSTTELGVLGGANLAAIETAGGGWEVLQFQSAQLIAPSTYELSRFLRGQAGTDGDMAVSLAPGARFVLIDTALALVDLAPDEIGLAFNWKCGPANRDLSHPAYATLLHAFTGIGLRPFSPAHVRGVRGAGGDLAIGWIRRTRAGGDSWQTVEVPLAEDAERYEVDILDGATLRRTLAATTPAATYTAAQQTADFGAPQASVSVRIYQISAVYGRGSPRSATL